MKKQTNIRVELKRLRKEKGTQEQVGKALGVTGTMIRYVENGQATPSGKLMLKLSSYFGVPVQVLFPDVVESINAK